MHEGAEAGGEGPAEEGDEGAGGDGDEQDVVGERPEEVLPDGAERGAAEAKRRGDVAQPPVDQHGVRRVDRDVRPRADGEPEVRRGECGGVVHAVADHRHAAFRLEVLDHAVLAVGQDAGNDFVDARLGRDRAGRALVVAGEEHDS